MTIRDIARTEDRAALAAVLCRPLPPRRRFWRRVRVLTLAGCAIGVGVAAAVFVVVVVRVVL